MTTPLFRRNRRGGGRTRGDDSPNLLSGVLIVAGVVLAVLGVVLVVAGVPIGGLGSAAGPAVENGTVAPTPADLPATVARGPSTADTGPPETATTVPASTTGGPAATTAPGISNTDVDPVTTTTVGTETPAEPTTEVVYRVNAGGPPLAPSGDGPGWSGDTADNPSAYGNAEHSGSRQTDTNDRISVGPSVPSSTPRELFRTGRYDDDDPRTSEDDPEMQWSFPVRRGETYVVRLYFAEIWLNETGSHLNEDVGPRRFDVRIEDDVVMERYDIYADVGPDRGTMKEFRVTEADDTLEITFLHVIENPHVSGIEIVRVENGTRAGAGTNGD